MENLDEVVRLLDLKPDGDGFLGGHPAVPPARVFGGQVMAQALRAACLTAPADRLPHSLHAYFVRGGVGDEPIRFEVERVRDGRSVSARSVTARQSAGAIFTMSVSLAAPAALPEPEPGAEPVPAPEELPRLDERLAPYAAEHNGWWVRPRAFDLRYVDPHPREALDRPPREDPRAPVRMWVRALADLPDDPALHACLAAYLSDMTLLDPVMLASRRTTIGPGSIASLDHAMWFHAIPDPGRWLLYERTLVALSDRRGLATGALRDEQGRRLCTVMQEGHLSDRPAVAPRW